MEYMVQEVLVLRLCGRSLAITTIFTEPASTETHHDWFRLDRQFNRSGL